MLEITEGTPKAKPRKQKRKTNVQVVSNMMNYSAAGALKQAFILQAIERYAQKIIKSEPWSETSLISFAAWKTCAEEVLETLEKHYADQ